MEQFQVYDDIQRRTNGNIYIGVVGPVRTGKSTFVRHFMEILAIPGMKEEKKNEIRDQLPLSGSGKMITTIEPKFIPNEPVEVILDQDHKVKIKLIDCVGYLVKGASGNVMDGKERMVKTPWTKTDIPFHEAADLGTQKVIDEHATIGIVVTTDGSFGELSRENFLEAEKRSVAELKRRGKPFILLYNTVYPYSEETQTTIKKMEKEYHVTCLPLNCEQLKKEDILLLLQHILYEFPIHEIQYFIPKWMEMLPVSHPWKKEILLQIKKQTISIKKIKDITKQKMYLEQDIIDRCIMEETNLSDGTVKVKIQMKEQYYYQLLSEMSSIHLKNEYDLINMMKEFSDVKEKYQRVEAALDAVGYTGYGVVLPKLTEIVMEEPAIIRQGNKYGVKIKTHSPSIHMIKADVETEIAPIVGTEQQANDLIRYINESENRGESVWNTNIFGKTIEELIQDEIRNKISVISEQSQNKLQDTLKKIVNDSKGGFVCIII